MNYLSVEDITKSFGDRVLFENITFGIDQGQKAAIVAKNGEGKTTLLECLIGTQPIDSGRIVFRKELRLAFMEQSDQLGDNNSIIEEIYSFDLPEMQALKAYNQALNSGDEKKIEASYAKVNELNAWDVEVRVNQILSVLKLDVLTQKVGQLSGGQKKRIALAKVLIAEPDFMILDEPTNHLDLDMIEWLEEYLSKSKSTILMVTHDRYFLEVVCDTIFEMSELQLFKYKGNFSYYLEKKAEREEQRMATIEKAKNQFRKELEWMRRQPKARGTKQKARQDAFFETKKLAKQRIEKDELEFPVKMERLGTKIVELHRIGKAYDTVNILNDFSYTFKRQERVGIVGGNGTGKSTFLKMVLGHEDVDKGKVVIGDTVVFGYYDQELPKYPDDKKVIEVIRDIAEFIPLEKGRQLSAAQLLERFLFPRNMHFNYVKKLSGGEKRRLKLLTVLMKNPNFLILDEPTNDLDIFVLSVLEEYLRSFQGCLMVVSHDRYFMDKMVDHLFAFDGKGNIKDLMGNYQAYRLAQNEADRLKRKVERQQKEESAPKVEEAPKEKRKLSYKEQQEFNSLESELESLEEEKEKLTIQLGDTSLEGEILAEAGKRLSEVVSLIDQKTDRWLELSEFA